MGRVFPSLLIAILPMGCSMSHPPAASPPLHPPSGSDDQQSLQLVSRESNELERLLMRETSPAGQSPEVAGSIPRGVVELTHAGDSPTPLASERIGELPRLFSEIKTNPMIHALESAGGRSLVYWEFGNSGPATLILGGMHGNEYSPTVLSAAFIEWLEENPDAVARGRIVVAPLVDPDGFASRTRGNDHGVDLNRNYPAKNWRMRAGRHGARPLSEPESRFVMDLLEKYEPACIVSIHGPLACVNYDGPAEELARRMSHACGLPVRASVGYATPGSFGSYAGVDQQIPTITLELRPGRALDPDFDACRKALMAAHEFSLEQPAR